mmetsp:Transcript_24013/g.55431  ORF Transcript_24013/g.55431 Transcript_24013/m.55431 type:complete len:411 (+) Transcript_24013:86-1318(+)|eukprot:25623-Amphidinium_carterae.1
MQRSDIFELLNQSKWSEALQACDEYPEEKEVAFERAYCLYQLNQHQEALELKKSVGDGEARWSQLEAQVRYTMGDYNTCAQMYEDFYKQDESNGALLVNSLAAHVAVGGQRGKRAAAIGNIEKKMSACKDAVMEYVKEHSDSMDAVVSVMVSLSQLYVQTGRTDQALQLLADLPAEVRSQPRILEVVVALQQGKNGDSAIAGLRQAIEYWTSVGEEGEETLALVLQLASKAATDLKDSSFAAEVFKLYLSNIDGSDTATLCGLVAALVNTDVEEAEEYAQRLQVPAFDHLDPEELELAPIPKMSVLRKAETEQDAPEAKRKRNRKKKIRYPKNFDPEKPGPPPDPERWLPKKERTEYKKKMRKRDKTLRGASQGGAVSDDAAFRAKGPSTAQLDVASDKPSVRKNKKGKK